MGTLNFGPNINHYGQMDLGFAYRGEPDSFRHTNDRRIARHYVACIFCGHRYTIRKNTLHHCKCPHCQGGEHMQDYLDLKKLSIAKPVREPLRISHEDAAAIVGAANGSFVPQAVKDFANREGRWAIADNEIVNEPVDPATGQGVVDEMIEDMLPKPADEPAEVFALMPTTDLAKILTEDDAAVKPWSDTDISQAAKRARDRYRQSLGGIGKEWHEARQEVRDVWRDVVREVLRYRAEIVSRDV